MFPSDALWPADKNISDQTKTLASLGTIREKIEGPLKSLGPSQYCLKGALNWTPILSRHNSLSDSGCNFFQSGVVWKESGLTCHCRRAMRAEFLFASINGFYGRETFFSELRLVFPVPEAAEMMVPGRLAVFDVHMSRSYCNEAETHFCVCQIRSKLRCI